MSILTADAPRFVCWVFAALFALQFGNAYLIRRQVRQTLMLPEVRWRYRSAKVHVLVQLAARVAIIRVSTLVVGAAFAWASIAGKSPPIWLAVASGLEWVRTSLVLGRAVRVAELLNQWHQDSEPS